MAIDRDKLVQDRVLNDTQLKPWKDQAYSLMKLVSGDILHVTGAAYGNDPRRDNNAIQFPKIFMTAMMEGRSNYPLQHLQTLLLQTTFSSPEIDVLGVSPEAAWFHKEYIRKRINRYTMAGSHLESALMYYLVTGLGCPGNTFIKGSPAIVHANPLDMKWDTTAPTMDMIKWQTVLDRAPYWQWESIYGKEFTKHFSDFEGKPDYMIGLQFYFDLGLGGKDDAMFYVTTEKGEIVAKNKTPFVEPSDDGEVPFLPFEMMTWSKKPYNLYPTGKVLDMIPHAMSVWRAEAYIDDILNRGAGFMEVKLDQVLPEYAERLTQGRRQTVVPVKADSDGDVIKIHPGFSVPRELYENLQRNLGNMISISGADTFASVNTAPETNFASEVSAYNARAGLTADAVAKDLKDTATRLIHRFICLGAKYDTGPLTLRYEDDTPIEFSMDSPAGPPFLHLRPDAEIIVQENSTRYESEQSRTAKELQDLQTALAAGQQFPLVAKHFVREWLKGRGVSNPDELLIDPMQQAGGMVGAQDAMPMMS